MIPTTIVQQLLNGLVLGVIYLTLSVGLTMIYGVLRLLHIAHAGVYAIGAYVGFTSYIFFHNIWVSMVAAVVLSALIGVLIERFLYLPLLERPAYIPLVISVSLYLFMSEICANIWGHHPLGFYTEIPLISYNFLGVVVTSHELLILAIITSLLCVLGLIINKSKIGLASRALAQDMEISQVMGINPKRVVDFNFLVGSALAGLGGVLVGIYYAQVFPYMGDIAAYKALVVLVLGGLGSMMGAAVGALILGVSETFLISYFGHLLPREAFAFIILIVFLLVRPQGLFGRGR